MYINGLSCPRIDQAWDFRSSDPEGQSVWDPVVRGRSWTQMQGLQGTAWKNGQRHASICFEKALSFLIDIVCIYISIYIHDYTRFNRSLSPSLSNSTMVFLNSFLVPWRFFFFGEIDLYFFRGHHWPVNLAKSGQCLECNPGYELNSDLKCEPLSCETGDAVTDCKACVAQESCLQLRRCSNASQGGRIPSVSDGLCSISAYWKGVHVDV